jgi:TRAP-type uncharacterized transport system fused permease subunit
VLWLIVAGGILAIYWLPWVLGKLPLNLGEWGTTAIVAGVLTVVLLAEFRRRRASSWRRSSCSAR